MKHSRSVMFAVIIIAAALALAICGCGEQAKEHYDPSIPIVVEEGQEFVIVLESNPSTGYQWQLTQPLEGEILSLVKTDFEESEEEGLLGAAGEERWTFKAEGRGDTTIDFTYVRPWEERPEGALEGAATGLAEEKAAGPFEDEEDEDETELDDVEEEPTELGEDEDEAELDDENETTEHEEEEDEVVEIAAPEVEDDTIHRTFTVEVKKQGSKGEEPKEYDDPGTEIEVELDYKFAIHLESSPSTGHRWQLAQPLDESIVELVKTEYKREEKKSEETEGEGEDHSEGVETWTFEAVGEGETEIHFEYVNTTEEDAAPEEEKEFKIKVHSGEEGTGITHD